MITSLLLLLFFVILCITITNAFNKIENFDIEEREENKKDNCKEDNRKIIMQDGPINYIMTDKAEFYEKTKNPISVNITYNIKKRNPNCGTLLRGSTGTVNSGADVVGTVSNNAITIGHGTTTTLGSAPFQSCPVVSSSIVQPIDK